MRRQGRVPRPEDLVLSEAESATLKVLGSLPTAPIKNRAVYVAMDVVGKPRRYLRDRWYKVVDVRNLPRRTPDEHRAAIEGWLQGMVEGTIPYCKETIDAMDREIKVHGLVVSKSQSMRLEGTVEQQSVDELLRSFAGKPLSIAAGATVSDDETTVEH